MNGPFITPGSGTQTPALQRSILQLAMPGLIIFYTGRIDLRGLDTTQIPGYTL